jgi:hypothetical protein
MARLFPAMNPAEIENPGERSVARALVEQLPNKVEVFHSFNWLSRSRNGTLQEGECDFVLLDPDCGLLFVEVKGGSLVFDGCEWVREVGAERRTLNKDPFSQAQRAMHDIVDLVKRRFPRADGELPCTFGFAVAFPDCRISGTLPPSIKPELILDAARITALEESIRRVFASFRRNSHRALTDRELDSVREALYPRYQLLPVTWRKVEDQEERLRRMTTEQQRILDILANQPKAAIRGVAGSGKTILALAKAQSLARAGMRTLLLCYNRPLKDWLQEAVPESFGDTLVIDTYHGLADDLCKVASMRLQEMGNPKDQAFWTETAPEALMQACERLGPEHKFDAVVVDEGQDFHDLWWTSLDSVFRDPGNKGCYYVFYDPKQNLYVEQPSLPGELGRPYELQVNCRNTVLIAEHCAALVGYENSYREGAPVGVAPEVVRVRTTAEGFKEAGRRVRLLCMPNQGGLQMSQVAVLAPGFTEKIWPAHFETIPLTKSFDQWRRKECVLIASWSRFKGLEADAVVIIEVPTKGEAHLDANRYVARSRAKHLLTIIEVEG